MGRGLRILPADTDAYQTQAAEAANGPTRRVPPLSHSRLFAGLSFLHVHDLCIPSEPASLKASRPFASPTYGRSLGTAWFRRASGKPLAANLLTTSAWA